MMMTDDIDTFIRNQKDKLRLERQALKPQAPINSVGYRPQKVTAPISRQRAPTAVQPDNLADPTTAPLPRSQPAKQAVRTDDPPIRPSRPEEDEEKPLVAKMGHYEERRRKFNSERQKDYHRLQSDDVQSSRRRRAGDPEENGRPPFLPGTKSDSAKTRAKVEERNKEYQEFKAQEEAKFKCRFDHMKPRTGEKWAEPTPRTRTPPPLRDEPAERPLEDTVGMFGEREKWEELLQGGRHFPSSSLERHNSETRLNELERAVMALRNQAARQPEPLEREAAERHRHRRWSQTRLDPQAPPTPPPAMTGEKSGFLELPERRSGIRRREAERNREYNDHLKELAEKDGAKRASRFRDDSPRRDDRLTEKRYLDAMMDGHNSEAPRRAAQKPVRPPASKPTGTVHFQDELLKLDSYDSMIDNVRAKLFTQWDAHKSDSEWLSPRSIKDLDKRPPKGPGRRQTDRGGGRRGGRGEEEEEEAGLAFGRNASESAQKRRKDRYRQELEEQMEEARQRALREKEEARKEQPDAPLMRSRSHSELGRSGNAGGTGLTQSRSTSGLDALLGSSSEQTVLGAYTTSADDAYNFYGSKNPFESNGYGDDLLGEPAARAGGGKSVRFDGASARGGGGATPGLLGAPDQRSSERKAQQQKEYASVLQQQMQEKQQQKQKAKADQEAYDKRFEQEVPFFSAFGRGGGGAPVKDSEGNVRADLRSFLAENGPTSSRRGDAANPPPPPPPQRAGFDASPYEDGSLRLNLTGTLGSTSGGGGVGGGIRSVRPSGPAPLSARPQTNALGEVTHARGGHGILGQPLTDAQKESRQNYCKILNEQIEEKRLMKEREREEQRQAEEKEMRKIEEERRKMQLEEEEDRKRRAEKEEEAKRKNEEAMRRQEEERRRQRARSPKPQRQASPDQASHHQPEPRHERSSSPPVPAVLNALKKEGKTPPRTPRTPRGSGRQTQSPAPPKASRQPDAAPASPPRARPAPQDDLGSSFALRDLRRIKQQLHSERERVERALLQQHYSVDVSDPRLSARGAQPPPAARPVAVVARPPIDPFEAAYEKQRPVPVRRQPQPRNEAANERELKEFKALKGRPGDLPGTPLTSADLELQQEQYLRQQEERLRRLQQNQRAGSSFAADMPGMAPQDLGLMPRGASPDDAAQLQAETAFIGINGAPFLSSENPFSLPPEPPLQADSALVPSGRSSQVDPDFLARKNAERFRRLQAMEQENNMASNAGDYEEVLNRFLEKQGRRPRQESRPPRAPSSGRALPFDLGAGQGFGLDPLAENESTQDALVFPEPVSRSPPRKTSSNYPHPVSDEDRLYDPPAREDVVSR